MPVSKAADRCCGEERRTGRHKEARNVADCALSIINGSYWVLQVDSANPDGHCRLHPLLVMSPGNLLGGAYNPHGKSVRQPLGNRCKP
ncbi:MAG: hypothetical protein AW09_004632 [Candidatus Accumulibacter phosphatis]|uniref:Uncharacterized protein n=1 Tax=Candidatus Accumulibacter phosphatis TaxID=327160 RepID=A0A084Y6D3_9PROT|nr:MAG: hypothetical protein AW09_004632 [Candidatus Accumulibacter phosphatis]